MADVKITQLPEDIAPTFDDLAIVVDSPGVTPATKKVTLANLVKALGWIDARSYATIELANTAAYNAGKLLVISTNWTLTANTSITAKVMRLPGGSFTKASTYTLTFSSSFENPSNGQCFISFSTGNVTFGVGSVKEVHPEWWGITGTADNVAIQSAIDSISAVSTKGAKVKVLGNNYNIAETVYFAHPGEFLYDIELVGNGHNSTVFSWQGAVGGTILNTGSGRGFRIKGVLFHGQSSAKHCVMFGGIEGDGTTVNCRFEDCRFTYATYASFAADYRMNGWNNKFLNCEFNNSIFGFVTGSANANLFLFDTCAFNDNAFGIGPMGDPSHSTVYTSKITGQTFTLYDGSTPVFAGISLANSIFTTHSEADVLIHAISEAFKMVGCGGENSRMFIGDRPGIFVEPTPGSSNAASVFNVEGGFYHGFGTVADSLNNPFISIEDGLMLSIKNFKTTVRLAAPRSMITIKAGYLRMENVHFDLLAEVAGSWPIIMNDAASVAPRNVDSMNVVIRRGDLGADYDRQWDLYPVEIIDSGAPAAKSGRKVIYLSQTVDQVVDRILVPAGTQLYSHDTKTITIRFIDGHSILRTIANGGTFYLKGNVNVQPATGSVMIFMSEYSGGSEFYWREVSRNF